MQGYVLISTQVGYTRLRLQETKSVWYLNKFSSRIYKDMQNYVCGRPLQIVKQYRPVYAGLLVQETL